MPAGPQKKKAIGQDLRISFIPLFLLLLPLLEIAGFVIVGREIGALATVGLVILSSVAGSLLLRHQGFGVMARVRAEMDAGHDPSRQLAHGAMIVLAAILLIIPGFITDILAILLLLPPVRDFAWRLLKNRIVMATSFSSGFSARRRDNVIDLDDSDYSRDDYPNRPDDSSPWRRLKND